MDDDTVTYKRKRPNTKLSIVEKENAVLKQRVSLLEKELQDEKFDGEFLRRTYEQS